MADVELGQASADDGDCAICLLAAPAMCTALRTTECGHRFCEQCLGIYAMKKPIGEPVPCPLCRTELGPEDIPSTIALSIAPPRAGESLGLSFTSVPADPLVRVVRVAPGSPAEAAGVRTGMRLLSVQDVSVAVDESAVGIAARLQRAAASDDGHLRLRFHLQRPPRRADVRTAAGGPALPGLAPEDRVLLAQGRRFDDFLPAALGFFCCCNVTAQVYQRVFRAPDATCVRVALLLWTLFLASAGADMASNMVGYGDRNSTTSFLSAVRLTPKSLDLRDGISYGSELSWVLYAFVSMPALLTCWLVGGSYLRRAMVRLRRDEPLTMALLQEGAGMEGRPWFGSFCICCCVAHRMLTILVVAGEGARPSDREAYSVWRPLAATARVRAMARASEAPSASATAV